MRKLYNRIKAKVAALATLGSAFIGIGALGAFGVCHTICEVAIAALAVFGITVIGMPFAFLQDPKFYVPFLVVGVASIAGSVYLYIHNRRCKK